MGNGAFFDGTRKHRYLLWRIWDPALPLFKFVGLNPSTANETEDDPTVRKVIGFAKHWGGGGIYMLNLFTLVMPNRKDLLTCVLPDPYRLASFYLRRYANDWEKVVFAWGSFPEARERARIVESMFPEAVCLGKNKDGSPKHPLYLKYDTPRLAFST